MLAVFTVTAISQNKKTNVEELLKLQDKFTREWEQNNTQALEYAKKHNLKVAWEDKNGRQYRLVKIVNGIPQYYITHNLGAAHTTRAFELWPEGSTGLNITGAGYDKLGEWDGGVARSTHVEFTSGGTSRVHIMDNGQVKEHATHVAGTMIANGVNSQAKGMAFEGELKSWDWTNDEGEMAGAAANGLEISNHSYGYIRGWYYDNGWQWAGNSNISPTEDYLFGFYDNTSKKLDIIALNAPYYLIVRSAGNDRGEGPGDAGQNGNPEKDGGDTGFDCIGTEGVAKNILTVGAVKQVWPYTGPSSVVMSSFSSWGPADDGRIKPDLVAKGVNVYSTLSGSDTDYGIMSGTSMSSPNASGTLALLQIYYQQTHNGTPMRSATLKGLAINTADEAGPYPGPDYMFGWGLLNAEEASRVIKEDISQNVIDELTLNINDQYERDINVPGGNPLKVTLCWTDRAGVPASPQLDPVKKMLIHDLDLEVIGNNDTVYYPWHLNRDNPEAPAVKDGKNYVDNVETVSIDNAPAGTYKIRVTYDGNLITPSQDFSLIISGIDEFTSLPECSSGMISPENGEQDVFPNAFITWEKATYATSYDVYFGTDGNGTQTPSNIYNGINMPLNGFYYLMKDDQTYYLKVIPRNNFGSATGCSDIWSFKTLKAIDIYPYVQDVEGVTKPDLPQFWQSFDYSDVAWQSFSLVSNSGQYSLACLYTGGLKQIDMDNWLVSPPLRISSQNEYNVAFELMTYIPSKKEHMSLYWGLTPYPEDMNGLIWSDTTLSYTDFHHFQSTFAPGIDTVIYLGWHFNTPQGYGVFMDDIVVSDFGYVGIDDLNTENGINVYGFDNSINFVYDEKWENASVTVYNITGKAFYKEKLKDKSRQKITFDYNIPPGIYLVRVIKNGRGYSAKVFLQ